MFYFELVKSSNIEVFLFMLPFVGDSPIRPPFPFNNKGMLKSSLWIRMSWPMQCPAVSFARI